MTTSDGEKTSTALPGSVRSNNPVYESIAAHKNDDVDAGSNAHHHTLGFLPGQAAPGTPLPWTAYVPVVANLAISNLVARYAISLNNTVFVNMRFTLTAAPTAAVNISLPVPAHPAYATSPVAAVGSGLGLRQGVGWQVGIPYLVSATTFSILYQGSVGQPWGPGFPVAWANTDLWGFNLAYEKL